METEQHILLGTFIKRPNRFLAQALILSTQEVVEAHVPDPGRLKYLLIPDAKVILVKANNPNRKTKYSLVGVKFNSTWVNINSQISNRLFSEEFTKLPQFKDFEIEKAEYQYGRSRIDFLMKGRSKNKENKKLLIEVKSSTLVKRQTALFPDAPTLRGAKHVEELRKSMELGYEAAIVFLIKRNDAINFRPYQEMDPKFYAALKLAKKAGVELCAALCTYDPIDKKQLSILKEVPIIGI